MSSLKATVKRFLFPPPWVIAVLAVVCTAALIAVFVQGFEESPIAYGTYSVSAYTTAVLSIFLAKAVPKKYRSVKQKVYEHPVGNSYMTDPKFKTRVTLYCSLTLNLLYVALNAVSGLIYHSVWFVVLAFYYTILAVMRFLLVRFVNRVGIGNDRFRELCRSRLCGIILLTVNLALSGAVLMMLYQDKGYRYNGILIYVMAAYTFYITVSAIVNLVKYRRMGSPVMSTAKIINMTAALVSMLSLETAMLSQFGEDTSPETRWILIAATGAGVSVIVAAMSLYTIVRTTKEIRKEYNYGK